MGRQIRVRLVETSASGSAKVYEKKLDKFFDKLVPSEGPAKTVEGELVRAVCRVNYRYFNDGDKFFEGYGCETAGPSVTYLYKCPVKGVNKLIDSIEGNRQDSAYEKFLVQLIALVVDYVESKGGKYSTNGKDSRDCESNWTDDDEDEDEDEDEGWEEYNDKDDNDDKW